MKITTTAEYVLRLTPMEARWLKYWMQNPLADDESEKSRSLREAFFHTLPGFDALGDQVSDSPVPENRKCVRIADYTETGVIVGTIPATGAFKIELESGQIISAYGNELSGI